MTLVPCPACEGEGGSRLPGLTDVLVCPHCKGKGQMTKAARMRLMQQKKYWDEFWQFDPLCGD
jgi:DnaJ-class molecular chaperone